MVRKVPVSAGKTIVIQSDHATPPSVEVVAFLRCMRRGCGPAGLHT